MSSLPVWSSIDPLMVLALSDAERRKLEEDQRRARVHEEEAGLGKLLD